MKLFNLKCEDNENIYDITFIANDINNAIELAKEYLSEYKLDPLGLWEV